MRREEIEALAAEIESDAREAAQESAGAQPSGRLQIERAGKADGLAQAARMIREALARHRTSPCAPTWKTIRISEAVFSTWPSPFSPPRPIAEAGPGLWSVVALAHVGAAGYDVEVMQLASAKVTP